MWWDHWSHTAWEEISSYVDSENIFNCNIFSHRDLLFKTFYLTDICCNYIIVASFRSSRPSCPLSDHWCSTPWSCPQLDSRKWPQQPCDRFSTDKHMSCWHLNICTSAHTCLCLCVYLLQTLKLISYGVWLDLCVQKTHNSTNASMWGYEQTKTRTDTNVNMEPFLTQLTWTFRATNPYHSSPIQAALLTVLRQDYYWI